MRASIKIVAILLTTLILLSTSCREGNIVTPTPLKPPGYQEDIPWPSLADSPWPMYRGDPQGTGRARTEGPTLGILEWVYDGNVHIESTIVVGGDSSIYFNSPHGLNSLSTKGGLNWLFESRTFSAPNSPIVLSSGAIFHINSLGRIYNVTPDGKLIWELSLPENNYIMSERINIGKDGTIYFLGGSEILYAISPEGNLKWEYNLGSYSLTHYPNFTFSPEGDVIYIAGKGPSLIAFNVITQGVVWVFGESQLGHSPVVDSDGHIYINVISEIYNNGNPSLYSINPDGSIRWSYAHNSRDLLHFHTANPTIDKNGNIYFVTDSLYSWSFDGKLRWKISLTDYKGYWGFSLVCDLNNNIYVLTPISAETQILKLYNDEGELVWSSSYYIDARLWESPSIGFGRIYVPSFRDSKIFSIK